MGMKKLLVVLAVIMLLPHTVYSFTDEESFKNEATSQVKLILSDPDSANFRNLQVITNSKGEKSVCGEVNARNKFGGYIGFTPFSYAKGEIAMFSGEGKVGDVDRYQLAGCAGAEREFMTRFEVEATFSCNVIWNLIVNVVVNKEDKNVALDASITTIKNRAKENGNVLLPEQEIMVRTQFSQALEKTLADKKQVNIIKKNFKYQEYGYIQACMASAVDIIKTQRGLKE